MKILSAVLAAVSTVGCVQTPVTLTVAQVLGKGPSVDALKLNPDLKYLRVSVQGRTALMVLGYVDASARGNIETWYSREGEVLRLQNGRIVGTSGLTVDWLSVKYTDLPDWAEVAQRPSVEFSRQRDEMPGYRYGISERLSLRAVRPPANALLKDLPATELVWYEETVVGPSRIPSARYGIRTKNGVSTVVYGEQCLAHQFCMAWQTWPVTP